MTLVAAGHRPAQTSVVFTSMSVLLGSLAIFSVFLALLSHLIYGTTATRFRPFLMMSVRCARGRRPAQPRVGPYDAHRADLRRRRRHARHRRHRRRPTAAYRPALAELGRPVEFIYVVDGPMPRAMQALRALKAAGEPIEILSFATAVRRVGRADRGLPPRRRRRRLHPHPRGRRSHRTCCRACSRRWTATDLVVGRGACSRQPPRRPQVRPARSTRCSAPRCRTSAAACAAMRAEVAKELTIYGNQYRFLPLLAQAQGFAVRELDLPAVRPRQRVARARCGSTPACCSTSSPSTSCSAS